MDFPYPAAPADVPTDFTKPSFAYRRQAWLAVTAIALFLMLYVGFGVWLGIETTLLLLKSEEPGEIVVNIAIATASLFLAAFMLKALFFVKLAGEESRIELTRDQQPKLFAFIELLADEAETAHPHRVFVSARVNACVFYDLSILNLFLPSRKNLEIGLGLVNVLTLTEFKAVMAHEFGHFSQRSMAVGRWVYIAQQIATHIVHKRDAFDGFLRGLSRFDLRIAWIGWLLSAAVWLIRRVVDISFRGVFWAQRALSQEMEFHADRVAVSLSGSEAIVHALYKLNAADDAWEQTWDFSVRQHHRNRTVANLYPLQQRILERLRIIYDEPYFGIVPPIREHERQGSRLFKAGLGNPPKMWLSHPLNYEREAHAKATFISAGLDQRSAWELFVAADTLQQQVSLQLFNADAANAQPLSESLAALDEYYSRPVFHRSYQGLYLGRSITRRVKRPHELFDPNMTLESLPPMSSLYGSSVGASYVRLRSLSSEISQLRGIQEGALKANGDLIVYQGLHLSYDDLDAVIKRVAAEAYDIEVELAAHDRRCRSVHRAIAKNVGNGWEEYWEGLVNALHYAEHGLAYLHNESLVMHDLALPAFRRGKLDEWDMARLVSAAGDVRLALHLLWEQQHTVCIDADLLERMDGIPWQARFEEFKLPSPNEQNIGPWLGVVDTWVNAAGHALATLRDAAMDALLLAETQLRNALTANKELPAASAPSVFPSRYKTLLVGDETPLASQVQMDRWWDRFRRADGKLKASGKWAIAAATTLAVTTFLVWHFASWVTVQNGLARDVVVAVGWQKITLPPITHRKLFILAPGHARIATYTSDGNEIEAFDQEVSGRLQHHVYNVASASNMLELHRKGDRRAKAATVPQRWFTSDLSVYTFERLKSGSGDIRDDAVLVPADNYTPDRAVALLEEADDQVALILNHARWDAATAVHTLRWVELAAQRDHLSAVVAERLQRDPVDMAALLAQLQFADTERQNELCADFIRKANTQSNNGDLQYLRALCLPNTQRASAMLDGHTKWAGSGWFALGASDAYIAVSDWGRAHIALNKARKAVPALAPQVAVDIFRLRRILAKHTITAPPELLSESEKLRQIDALERGIDISKNAPLYGYRELKTNNVMAAALLVDDSAEGARLLRMVAASDGAPRDLIEKALRLPSNKGLDADTLWPTIALALRNNRDPQPYYMQIAKNDAANLAIKDFLLALKRGEPPQRAAETISWLPLKTRALGYSAGAILLGGAAPRQWRIDAVMLLFNFERPNFL